MSRSRDNASAVTTVPSGVGRNMVINGGMNVAQRSASVTGIGAAAGYFTCDRWKIDVGSTAGRFTMSQTADGPNGISANCIKLDCTTADASIAAGEYLLLNQRFEGQNLQRIGKGVAGAKEVTVSFYVKANAAFTFALELIDRDNDRQITKLFDTTTGWARHELTYAADVDDGSSPFDDNSAASLDIYFWLHSGATYTGGTLNTAAFANTTQANRAAGIDSFFSSTDNNFFITGVQMEVGPVATEFEQEDISITLAKCQRYLYKAGPGGAYERMGIASNLSTTTAEAYIYLPVAMRATPTLVAVTASEFAMYDSSVSGNIVACTGVVVESGGNANGQLMVLDTTVSSGLTAGGSSGLMTNNNTTAHITLDAEL